MSEDELREMVRLLKVLADESRLRMVGILATREATGVELAALLDLRAATVSHHLARLREIGLLQVRREGTARQYRLDADALRALREGLLEPERVVALVPEAQPGTFEKKVLDAFFSGPKLLRIPSARKKRDVILAFLAERFAVGEEVSEAVVNERLQEHHWDSATLRRELVGGGWMTRQDGRYVRVR